MIVLDMIKKRDVLITHKHYSLENGIFTLQIDVGDYDLTNKTITAKFNPKEVETGNLDVIDGIINLPIYSNLLKYGSNYIQLNFRWDIDKLEQSPKMIWIINKSLETKGVAEEDIDIISYLINEIKSAKETTDRVISDVGDIKQSLNHSIEDASTIKTNLDDVIVVANTKKVELENTVDVANDSRVALEGKTTEAGTAHTNLHNKIGEANTTKEEIEQAIVDNQIVTQSEFTQHKLDYAQLVGKVMSYDDYFSLGTKDINTTYILDKTVEIAKAKKVLNQTPSLIINNNKVISDKLPIQDGLKIWVDSKYKSNIDASKAVYNDLSGNNNNGELQGFAFNDVSGWSDGLNFDGVDDKVLFTMGAGTTGLSFELIFLWDDLIINAPRYTRLINANSDLLNLYKTDRTMVFKFSTKTRPSINFTMLEYNKDNHVVGTVDFITGDIKLYLNGVLVSTTSNEPFTFNSIRRLYIGSYNEMLGFVGNQKMLRFYDRPLTQEEINHNYDIEFLAELPETPTEPIEPTPTEPTKEYSIHNSLLMPKKVRFIGHRGLSGLQPENTLPSFAECGIKGIWGCETDIRVTSDGEFVCMHDATVDRTTDGTGNVSELTLAQIKAMTIDYGNNIGNHTGLKVPTLEEMLIECSKYGVVPMLHLYIDTAYIEELVNRVNKLGFESTVIYTCTSPTQLNLISELTNGKSLTFGLGGSTSDLSIINPPTRSNQGRYLNYNAYNNYPNSIDEIHLTKQVAMCWVINNVEDAKDFINRGIDGIATDYLTNEDLL